MKKTVFVFLFIVVFFTGCSSTAKQTSGSNGLNLDVNNIKQIDLYEDSVTSNPHSFNAKEQITSIANYLNSLKLGEVITYSEPQLGCGDEIEIKYNDNKVRKINLGGSTICEENKFRAVTNNNENKYRCIIAEALQQREKASGKKILSGTVVSVELERNVKLESCVIKDKDNITYTIKTHPFSQKNNKITQIKSLNGQLAPTINKGDEINVYYQENTESTDTIAEYIFITKDIVEPTTNSK